MKVLKLAQHFSIRALLLGGLGFFSPASLGAQNFCTTPISPEKVLLIRDPLILEKGPSQTRGAWNFGTVIHQLAQTQNLLTPDAWLENWLAQWEHQTQWNGRKIKPRATHRLKENWVLTPAGFPDPHQAPFRLLSIVFRPDLRNQNAGEGRLIYGAYDITNGAPLDFTVIFEFQLPGTIESWAKNLAHLNTLSGTSYEAELVRLTSLFIQPRQLLQVRTNDFLLEFEWELREFALNSKNTLEIRGTGQTPDFDYSKKDSEPLVKWIQANENQIIAGQAIVPKKFLGGTAPLPEDSFKWLENSGLSEVVRREFSLQTCNGCHGGESMTNFLHVFPRYAGFPAWISRYLTDELEVRRKDLESILCGISTHSSIPHSPTPKGRVH